MSQGENEGNKGGSRALVAANYISYQVWAPPKFLNSLDPGILQLHMETFDHRNATGDMWSVTYLSCDNCYDFMHDIISLFYCVN